MEENEFRGFLEVFPVIRSRNYRSRFFRQVLICTATPLPLKYWTEAADPEPSQDSTSSAQNELDDDEWKSSLGEIDVKDVSEDPFWQKLRLKADKKVGPVESEKFCKAFQHVYEQLVYEVLSPDAIRNFVSSKLSTQ